MLGLILAPYASELQPVLIFDAAPLHLTPAVFHALAEAALW